jgi:Rhs element Vgr protein
MGYQSKNGSVFKGVVVKQTIKIDESEGSRLIVTCKDKALKLTINRKNAIFEDSTDSDIISSVVSDAGLSADAASTSVQHKEVVQYYATDWDFILSRAEVNGMVVITDSGKLVLAKPGVSEGPELQLQFGYDIIEFDGEIDATYQYSEVNGTSWDFSGQDMITASSSEPSVNEQGDITGSTLAEALSPGTTTLMTNAPLTSDEAKAWANAALLKSRLSRFRGNVTFQGSSKAVVNSTIKLMGLSARFNGNAFISGVSHTLAQGRWITTTELGLSPKWFGDDASVSAPPASGLLPGVKGLQTGIVKKINEDPDNEFRVQVEIPMLNADNKLVWARHTTMHASKNFGAFFMPEVNDEVVLGFTNEDPRYPVILGSTYSSANPPSETPDETNSVKSFLSSSQLLLKFDEENKVISVITPGGNSIVVSDEDLGITLEDQNGNTAQLNDGGISLDSASSISITAAESVSISGSDVELTGSQSVSVSGASISISGDQSVSVEGGTQCEVSSGGQTNVSGSMVNIN